MNKIVILFLLACVFYVPVQAQIIDFDTLQTSTVTDIDGNVYNTIRFGDTWWMTTNLRTKHYNDGSAILQMTKLMDDSETNDWSYWTMIDRWAYPALDSTNFDTYGLLYSYTAVINTKNGGVCPDGWSLADTADWWNLARVILGNESIEYTTGTRNTPSGGTETYFEANHSTGLGRYLKSDNGVLWTMEPTISRTCNQADMNIVPSGKLNTAISGFGELADYWTPNYVHSDGSGQGRRFFHFDYETHNMTLSWNHNSNMQCARCTKAADTANSQTTKTRLNGAIKVWPNPATDHLKVFVTDETTYKILALDGRLLKQGKLSQGENQIDLCGLPKGVYLFGTGLQVARIAIQ
jgi:uncharacterized protein (TIGR02145 family)